MSKHSVLGLGQGSLPSEILKRGLFQVGQRREIAEGTVVEGIYSTVYRSKVPLQVFSGETTLSPHIRLGRKLRYY